PLPFTSPVPSFDDFQVSHFLVFLITLTGGVQQFRRNLPDLEYPKILKYLVPCIKNVKFIFFPNNGSLIYNEN
ncbi:MAG: hypothetical protein ACTSPG_02650, partial [Candidatus Hodarchaeales archaeon]